MNITSVCYNFLKKSESKINLKTYSNEKLLRAASQKIDFFLKERKYGSKDWTNFVTKNRFYIVVSKQTKLFV